MSSFDSVLLKLIVTIRHTRSQVHYSTRTLPTCPSADSDLLIAAASTSLCPSASVFEILSEPARSHNTRVHLVIAPVTLSRPSTDSINTRWERELNIKGKSLYICLLRPLNSFTCMGKFLLNKPLITRKPSKLNTVCSLQYNRLSYNIHHCLPIKTRPSNGFLKV